MQNQQTIRELEGLHTNTTTKVQRQQTRELFSTRKEVTRTQKQRCKVNKQESYLALKKRSHEWSSKDTKSTNKKFIYHSKNATAKTQRQQTRDLFSSRKEMKRTQQERLTQSQQTRELFTTGKEVTRTQQQRRKVHKQEIYLPLKETSQELGSFGSSRDFTGTQQQKYKDNKQEIYLALEKRSHERNRKD